MTKSSDAAQVAQKCMLLRINQHGTVLSVDAASPKALFGFSPTDLVGRPLAAFVDVFGSWRRQFGEDASLLMMLGVHAQQKGESAWRVGVTQPVADADIGKEVRAAWRSWCQVEELGQGALGCAAAVLAATRRTWAPCCPFPHLASPPWLPGTRSRAPRSTAHRARRCCRLCLRARCGPPS